MWNRRQVLQGVGGLAAMSVLPHPALALRVKTQPRFAYVGSMEDGGSIHVFSINGGRWTRIQTVACSQPSCLVLHPGHNVIYVANEIDTFRGLPCGSVEAYSIDAARGTLMRISQQPLSLSGVRPQGLAISPDGSQLVVAVYGGGAFNVLPIAADGSLGRVSAIVKELGSGSHPEHQQSSHPHTVGFDATGQFLLGSDVGSDRLSVFRLAEDRLERISQTSLPTGSGPGSFAIHPSGHLLFVVNHLQASVCTYACNLSEGSIGSPLHVTTLGKSQQAHLSHALAIHPSGQFLYTTSDALAAWKINADTGSLIPLQFASKTLQAVSTLVISPAGDSIYALDDRAGEIVQFSINTLNGRVGIPQPLTSVPFARSMAIQYAEG
jgi:6-phosphogluconolactonase